MSAILDRWEVMPHGDLVEIDDGILTVEGQITMPLGKFPRRMTVIRLSGDRSAIWSAIALREKEMARIEAMGRPAVLIVPSDHHRTDVKIWKARYPAIRVVTPPGACDAVAEAAPVDATSDILEDVDTRFVVVPGTGEHEAALTTRRADGLTIVTNDVIANVAHPDGIGAQIMARLMGFGVSEPQIPRVIKYRVIEDKPALAAQFRAWAAEETLKRLIVSHGDPIDRPREVLTTLADGLSS